MDIEELALEAEFSNLSAAQQHRVLHELGSEEAYTRMRTALLATRAELMDPASLPEPSPAIRSALRSALRERHAQRQQRQPSLLAQLFTARVPAYQAALVMAALVAMFIFLRNDGQPEVIREKIVYVPTQTSATTAAIDTDEIARRVADSIREELRQEVMASSKTAPSPERSTRSRKRTVSHDATPVLMAANHDSTIGRIATPANQFVGLANLPQLAAQRRGKSLTEDSAYARFTVTMGRDTF